MPRSAISADMLHQITGCCHEVGCWMCLLRNTQALAEDFTLVCVLGSGNDYLPGTRGLQTIPSAGKGGLWTDYLQMRATDTWAGR